MEEYKDMIDFNVYSISQLVDANCPEKEIRKYIQYRKERWNNAQQRFRNLVSDKGHIYASKSYDEQIKQMKVEAFIHQTFTPLKICEAYDVDPIVALAKCVAIIRGLDCNEILLANIMQQMTI